jgi:hypothetical protein
MGVVTKCCTSQYLYSDMNSASKETENQNQINNIMLIKKIPEVKDSNQGLNYICSKECNNIISKISRTVFIKKLCTEMSTLEIYIFLKKLINWIISYEILNNDITIQKYINQIKIYTKIGTKKIICELNTFSKKFKKEEEELLLRSLSDWVMLIQLIMSLADGNLWKNRFIDKIIKNYVFDGIYFLVKIKDKFTNNKKETVSLDKIVPVQRNIKINSQTKNEIKKLVALVEDFVIDLTDFK